MAAMSLASLSRHAPLSLRQSTPPGRRLAVAVVVSLALHAAAVFGFHAGRGHGVAGSGPSFLSVRLVGAGDDGAREISGQDARLPSVDEESRAAQKSATGAGRSRPAASGTLPFDFAQSDYYYMASRLHKQPLLLGKIPFEYPEGAAARDGMVIARILINARGTVDDVIIDSAAPPGVFDEVTVKALARAQFSPGQLHGLPVPSQVLFEVRYSNPGAAAGSGNSGVDFQMRNAPLSVTGPSGR